MKRATPTFRHEDPLEGLDLPELAHEPPTTLLTVHACFTVRHIIAELYYHIDMDLLTRDDLAFLTELGQVASARLKKSQEI